ncbi:MAG TPA: hypothetical protein VKP30_31955 [Polyangiaceae bacterium]|nr:hypothetical protein [Polyangiaceae bacterium]
MMELQTLLERVEPSRLKQLGTLFALGDDLTKNELVDWVSQELPFCQVEEDGACVGIDGAFYIAVDWVNDMMTLELLRETSWVRHEADGHVCRFVVTEEASNLSLKDARLLLGLLSVATYNNGELPLPLDLSSSRFAGVLRMDRHSDPAVTKPRPSQYPSADAEVKRPSIPPGLSETFDSMRPSRQSVRPEASDRVQAAEEERSDVVAIEPALIEYILTLPRNSFISAAFALAERGARTHAVCVGPSGRAVLKRDTVEAAQRLYEDHRDSMPPPANQSATTSYRKRLTTSITFFGIPAPDASALVAIALEAGEFPEFFSDELPPPVRLFHRELVEAPEELARPILQLMYDCFYCAELDTVEALASEVFSS